MPLECYACKHKIRHEDRREQLGLANDSSILTTQCCARYCCSQQPDFLAQKEWLTEVVESKGGIIIFYPKYHCELNFIETLWSYVKTNLRKICTNSFADLEKNLPLQLESISNEYVRKTARYCFRIMSAYREGFEGPLLDYAVRKYKSHRRIPMGVLAQISAEYAEKKEKQKNK
jgi:hypothetical protein